jgi:hypothetical protein
MKSLWQKILRWFTKQKPTPEPVKPEPKPVLDVPVYVHVAGRTLEFAKLKESCTITSGVLDRRGFSCQSKGQELWASHDGLTCGWICMAWRVGGAMVAEYWDGFAVRSPYLYVSLFHITDPESPFAGRVPKTDDEVFMFAVSEDCQNRSTLWECRWPL